MVKENLHSRLQDYAQVDPRGPEEAELQACGLLGTDGNGSSHRNGTQLLPPWELWYVSAGAPLLLTVHWPRFSVEILSSSNGSVVSGLFVIQLVLAPEYEGLQASAFTLAGSVRMILEALCSKNEK